MHHPNHTTLCAAFALLLAGSTAAQQALVATTTDGYIADTVVVVKGEQSGSFSDESTVETFTTTTPFVPDKIKSSLSAHNPAPELPAKNPTKIMKPITAQETTITVIMVTAPLGQEQRMQMLADAYTSAGLTAQEVSQMLVLENKITRAREGGNAVELGELRSERERALSLKDRQLVRALLRDISHARKTGRDSEL